MRGEAKPAVPHSGYGSNEHSQSNSQLNPLHIPQGERSSSAPMPLGDGELKDGSVRRVRLHKPSQQNFPDLHFSLKSGR